MDSVEVGSCETSDSVWGCSCETLGSFGGAAEGVERRHAPRVRMQSSSNIVYGKFGNARHIIKDARRNKLSAIIVCFVFIVFLRPIKNALNKITSKTILYNRYLLKKVLFQHNNCGKHKTTRAYLSITFAEVNTYHQVCVCKQVGL